MRNLYSLNNFFLLVLNFKSGYEEARVKEKGDIKSIPVDINLIIN